MPTYAYACTVCEHRFEAQQSFTDSSLTVCPECSGRLRKIFPSVGVVFKGSGFYRNDSRSGKGGKVSSGAASANGESGSSGSGDAGDGAAKPGTSAGSSDAGKVGAAAGSPASGGAERSAGSGTSTGSGKPAAPAKVGASASSS